jgi:putative transposase
VEIGTSLASVRVVALLEQLVAQHGAPEALRCDNGPELIAQALTLWCEERGITLRYIQPGKPDQNAFIERFNRTYREEVLDAWLFTSMAQVREVTATWLETYNTKRPHDSLGRVPPLTFLRGLRQRISLPIELSARRGSARAVIVTAADNSS